jgi:hypothetical protein
MYSFSGDSSKNQFEGDSTRRRIQKFELSLATPLSMQNLASKTLLATPLSEDEFNICKVFSNESISYSGFPNRIPHINWQKYFPKFEHGKGNDAALHLIRFHMHICKLGVEFHEDCLMKLFMANLEGKARLWYEGLKLGNLYSLKDFHIAFFKHYGESNPSPLVF